MDAMHDRTFHLWDLAKSLVRTLFSAFGEPQEIAARGAVDRKTYIWLIAWLHACETLLRRLLLIEARALEPLGPAAPRRRPHSQRAPKPVAFSLNPDDWRVSFRCAYGPPASRRPALTRTGETPSIQAHHPAIPLAHRAEALYRVCKNPLPYVRRIARLIARLPQAIARILKPPRERKRRSGDPPNPIPIIGYEPWGEIEALSPNTS